MKYVINDQIVLSQPLAGPLAAYIPPFGQWASEQGYARYSIYRQVLLAGCFSRWLEQRGVSMRQVSSEHPKQYLQYRARRQRIARGDGAALKQLLDYLRRREVIPAEKVRKRRLVPAERCAQAFEQYLCQERALANATVLNYVPLIREFLTDRFGNGPVRLSRLGASDVIGFVQRQARRLHLKRAKLMTTALRSFLQYARYRGDITLDLAAAVPVVANWSMTSIPRAVPAKEVRRLLSNIGQGTAIERRDYAIFLLLSRLGLRASEVVFLELNDIDWNAGCLHVRGKGGRRIDLPLLTDVGEAIAAYLREGRPPSASRRVFLRAKAPNRGFQGPSAVSCIVRRAIERTGINAPTKGAHQFRHALAMQMLHQGASLGEIGEVLGHRSPETTKIYAKVDLDALRPLAFPWPGGAR